MPDPFLKALEDLLEDQLDSIRFEKVSPAYAAKENRKAEIIKTLKTLPETLETKAGAVKVHDLPSYGRIFKNYTENILLLKIRGGYTILLKKFVFWTNFLGRYSSLIEE